MVDGTFYEKSYQPMPAEIDENAVIGYIEFYSDTIPKKDGETNISKALIGAPYARVEGGIALLCENEWYLCTADRTPERMGRFIRSMNGDRIQALSNKKQAIPL